MVTVLIIRFRLFWLFSVLFDLGGCLPHWRNHGNSDYSDHPALGDGGGGPHHCLLPVWADCHSATPFLILLIFLPPAISMGISTILFISKLLCSYCMCPCLTSDLPLARRSILGGFLRSGATVIGDPHSILMTLSPGDHFSIGLRCLLPTFYLTVYAGLMTHTGDDSLCSKIDVQC